MLVSRYNNLAGRCSIAAGFSFDALIEIDFEEADELSSTLAVVKPARLLPLRHARVSARAPGVVLDYPARGTAAHQ